MDWLETKVSSVTSTIVAFLSVVSPFRTEETDSRRRSLPAPPSALPPVQNRRSLPNRQVDCVKDQYIEHQPERTPSPAPLPPPDSSDDEPHHRRPTDASKKKTLPHVETQGVPSDVGQPKDMWIRKSAADEDEPQKKRLKLLEDDSRLRKDTNSSAQKRSSALGTEEQESRVGQPLHLRLRTKQGSPTCDSEPASKKAKIEASPRTKLQNSPQHASSRCLSEIQGLITVHDEGGRVAMGLRRQLFAEESVERRSIIQPISRDANVLKDTPNTAAKKRKMVATENSPSRLQKIVIRRATPERKRSHPYEKLCKMCPYRDRSILLSSRPP